MKSLFLKLVVYIFFLHFALASQMSFWRNLENARKMIDATNWWHWCTSNHSLESRQQKVFLIACCIVWLCFSKTHAFFVSFNYVYLDILYLQLLTWMSIMSQPCFQPRFLNPPQPFGHLTLHKLLLHLPCHTSLRVSFRSINLTYITK